MSLLDTNPVFQSLRGNNQTQKPGLNRLFITTKLLFHFYHLYCLSLYIIYLYCYHYMYIFVCSSLSLTYSYIFVYQYCLLFLSLYCSIFIFLCTLIFSAYTFDTSIYRVYTFDTNLLTYQKCWHIKKIISSNKLHKVEFNEISSMLQSYLIFCSQDCYWMYWRDFQKATFNYYIILENIFLKARYMIN